MMAARRSRRAGERGFVVVAVLWMLAAFAVLAGVYSVYVATAATVLGTTSERLRAEIAARGGLELVAGQLAALDALLLPPIAAFAFRVGGAQVHAEVSTESGRVDINMAPKELLAGLFASLGAAQQQAAAAAERIVAWRTAPLSTSDGADEIFMYRAAGRSYMPRQSPFPHVDEIWLLPNMPQAIVSRSLPFLTIYSGKPTVNLVAALPEVVAGLPGMTSEMAHGVLAQRQGLDRSRPLTGLLGPTAARYATLDVTRTFRVSLDVALDNGRRMPFEAVILVGEQDSEPYRVLSWTDQPLGPTAGQRR